MTDERLCQLCLADVATSFHHLIPRTVHRNKWFKKRYSRDQMRQGLTVCRQCHGTLHDLLTEKELGREYNTAEALLGHPQFARYIAWKRQRGGTVRSK